MAADLTGIADKPMAHNCLRLTTVAFAGLLSAALMHGPADARPLKKATCDALVAERAKLARQGVEKAILKGPEWTQANMPVQTLELVHRYLDIEDKLRFRCRGIKLPDLVPEQSASLAKPPSAPKEALKTPKKAPKKRAATPETKKKAPKVKTAPVLIKLPPVAASQQNYLPAAGAETGTIVAPPVTGALIPLPDRRPAPAAKAPAPAKKKAVKKKATAIQDPLFRSDSN